jgi:hypothetical protein
MSPAGNSGGRLHPRLRAAAVVTNGTKHHRFSAGTVLASTLHAGHNTKREARSRNGVVEPLPHRTSAEIFQGPPLGLASGHSKSAVGTGAPARHVWGRASSLPSRGRRRRTLKQRVSQKRSHVQRWHLIALAAPSHAPMSASGQQLSTNARHGALTMARAAPASDTPVASGAAAAPAPPSCQPGICFGGRRGGSCRFRSVPIPPPTSLLPPAPRAAGRLRSLLSLLIGSCGGGRSGGWSGPRPSSSSPGRRWFQRAAGPTAAGPPPSVQVGVGYRGCGAAGARGGARGEPLRSAAAVVRRQRRGVWAAPPLAGAGVGGGGRCGGRAVPLGAANGGCAAGPAGEEQRRGWEEFCCWRGVRSCGGEAGGVELRPCLFACLSTCLLTGPFVYGGKTNTHKKTQTEKQTHTIRERRRSDAPRAALHAPARAALVRSPVPQK